MITQTRLKELLHYEPTTGLFTWLVDRKKAKKGTHPTYTNHGYICIRIDTVLYGAHRLAWLYVHGSMPKEQLDHINRDRMDNRIDNLREVTAGQNRMNMGMKTTNTSGYTGVSWNKRTQRWEANIKANGKRIGLGHHKDILDAHNAYQAAKLIYHKI